MIAVAVLSALISVKVARLELASARSHDNLGLITIRYMAEMLMMKV